jgi:phage FluMu protein Com
VTYMDAYFCTLLLSFSTKAYLWTICPKWEKHSTHQLKIPRIKFLKKSNEFGEFG